MRARLLFFSLVAACSSPKPESAPPTVATVTEPPPERTPDAGRITGEEELAERIRLVVTAETKKLRECYEAGLAKDPTLKGHVTLVVDVAENGRASRVLEGKRDGLGDEEVKCFARVLKAARFHDGAASAMRIQVPLSFSPATPAP